MAKKKVPVQTKLVNGKEINYKELPYIEGKTICITNNSHSITSPHHIKSFYDLIKDINSPVVIDIGANKGYYTMLKLVKADLKIFSFEPLPNMVERFIKKNLRLNKLFYNPDIRVINEGLTDRKCKLELSYNMTENASIYPDEKWIKDTQEKREKYPNSAAFRIRKVMCDFNKLDDLDYIQELDKIDVMKIDVEGCEYLTLKGAEKTIEKYKPKLFIEIMENVYLERTGLPITFEGMFEYIKSLGYTKITPVPELKPETTPFNYICEF